MMPVEGDQDLVSFDCTTDKLVVLPTHVLSQVAPAASDASGAEEDDDSEDDVQESNDESS